MNSVSTAHVYIYNGTYRPCLPLGPEWYAYTCEVLTEFIKGGHFQFDTTCMYFSYFTRYRIAVPHMNTKTFEYNMKFK